MNKRENRYLKPCNPQEVKNEGKKSISNDSPTNPFLKENIGTDTCPIKQDTQSQRANEVLDFVRNHKPIDVSNLSKAVNLPRTTLNNTLEELKDAKLIRTELRMVGHLTKKFIFSTQIFQNKKDSQERDSAPSHHQEINITGEKNAMS